MKLTCLRRVASLGGEGKGVFFGFAQVLADASAEGFQVVLLEVVGQGVEAHGVVDAAVGDLGVGVGVGALVVAEQGAGLGAHGFQVAVEAGGHGGLGVVGEALIHLGAGVGDLQVGHGEAVAFHADAGLGQDGEPALAKDGGPALIARDNRRGPNIRR